MTPLNDQQQPIEGGADLHLHSRHSDGSLTPAEIVAMAGARGLAALSLTDHDTIAGLEEAGEESRKAGITFIPGIELGITYGHSEIHLLGYGIDTRSRRLRETLDQLAAERFERMEKMVLRLRRHGVPADFEEVRSIAGGTILSRLHLATYLFEKKFVGSRDEAFQRYIGNGGPAYVRRRQLNLKTALDLIIGSGGFPVLAHPALTRRDDLMEYLVRLGVRGIEVYYPRHSFSDISRYQKICRKYGLVATGGSDFHGGAKPDIELGASLTPPDELSRLLRYLGIEFS